MSPFGLGVDVMKDAVWKGQSGVRLMPDWGEIKGLESTIAAPVPDMDLKSLLPRAQRRTMGPLASYAVLAAKEAVEDSGLAKDLLANGDVGVAIGSTTGSPSISESFYRQFSLEKSIEGGEKGGCCGSVVYVDPKCPSGT